MGSCCSTASGQPVQPAGTAGADLRSFVVWGAKGLPSGDAVTQSDPYCIVRIGAKGSSWEDKPRSLGRRSRTMMEKSNPEWRLGFTIDMRLAGAAPEVHIRVFDKDFISEDDFLGEARISVADLGSVPRKELELQGKSRPQGTVEVGAGAVGFLDAQNIKPNPLFETIAKMGEKKSVKVEDITGDGPLLLGGSALPAQLRGLFWLSDQANGSALGSFGGPSKDGGGCSTGRMQGNRYAIRVAGDRTWSAAADKTATSTAVDVADVIYHFVFNDAQNPTKAQIYGEGRNLGIYLTAEWLLDFEMELDPANKDYPGSVVWARNSTLAGKFSSAYALVQVMDENGKRLEPAWSEFVKYQNSEAAGSSPGVIWYREIASS